MSKPKTHIMNSVLLFQSLVIFPFHTSAPYNIISRTMSSPILPFWKPSISTCTYLGVVFSYTLKKFRIISFISSSAFTTIARIFRCWNTLFFVLSQIFCSKLCKYMPQVYNLCFRPSFFTSFTIITIRFDYLIEQPE